MRALLIDVGGTLWSERSSPQPRGVAFPLSASALPPPERQRKLWERRLRSAGVPRARLRELCSKLNEIQYRAEGSEYLDVWDVISTTLERAGIVDVTPDAVRSATCLPARAITHELAGASELLALAKRRGLKVVVITNAVWRTRRDYWEDLSALSMKASVDAVVSSVDVKWRKPSRPFFDAALLEAGSAAVDCLVVGNSERNDVAPAKALGMTAWRVAIEDAKPRASSADRVFTSLADVANALMSVD